MPASSDEVEVERPRTKKVQRPLVGKRRRPGRDARRPVRAPEPGAGWAANMVNRVFIKVVILLVLGIGGFIIHVHGLEEDKTRFLGAAKVQLVRVFADQAPEKIEGLVERFHGECIDAAFHRGRGRYDIDRYDFAEYRAALIRRIAGELGGSAQPGEASNEEVGDGRR